MGLSPEARTKADEAGRVFGAPDPDYADSWCVAYRLPCGSTLHISPAHADRLEISTSVPPGLRSFRPY